MSAIFQEEQLIYNDEIINIVNEIKILMKEGRYNYDSFKNLKKKDQDKTGKSEDALTIYKREKSLKILKPEFPQEEKTLTKKLAYPYQYFNCLDDYQKPVTN